MDDMRISRRSFGGSIAGLLSLSLAGCVGDSESDGPTSDDDRDDDGHSHDDSHGVDDDHHDDDHSHDDDHHDDDHHHGDVQDIVLIDRSVDETVADAHHDHWHGSLPEIPHGEHVSLGAVFSDDEGNEIPIGDDEDYWFDARLGDDTADDVVDTESHGDHVHLHGESVGTATVVFQLRSDDHVEWEAPTIDAEVVEEE